MSTQIPAPIDDGAVRILVEITERTTTTTPGVTPGPGWPGLAGTGYDPVLLLPALLALAIGATALVLTRRRRRPRPE